MSYSEHHSWRRTQDREDALTAANTLCDMNLGKALVDLATAPGAHRAGRRRRRLDVANGALGMAQRTLG